MQMTFNARTAIQFWLDTKRPLFKACAIVGHAQVESYKELRTEVVGDKHIKAKDGLPAGSYGIHQWNGVRKKGLFDFARKHALKPASSLLCQLEYAQYEMNTTEKFAGDELAKAWTLYGSVRAFMHFERPAGYSRTFPTLGSHFDRRLAAAIALQDEWLAEQKAKEAA